MFNYVKESPIHHNIELTGGARVAREHLRILRASGRYTPVQIRAIRRPRRNAPLLYRLSSHESLHGCIGSKINGGIDRMTYETQCAFSRGCPARGKDDSCSPNCCVRVARDRLMVNLDVCPGCLESLTLVRTLRPNSAELLLLLTKARTDPRANPPSKNTSHYMLAVFPFYFTKR